MLVSGFEARVTLESMPVPCHVPVTQGATIRDHYSHPTLCWATGVLLYGSVNCLAFSSNEVQRAILGSLSQRTRLLSCCSGSYFQEDTTDLLSILRGWPCSSVTSHGCAPMWLWWVAFRLSPRFLLLTFQFQSYASFYPPPGNKSLRSLPSGKIFFLLLNP